MSSQIANQFLILQRTPLFAELTKEELSYIAERAIPRRFSPGQLIFSEGDSCPGLWIIESGRVRIFKSSPSGREQVLTIEGPGTSIGELPVFDGGKYPASAASVKESSLLFISKEDFQSLCIKHPDVALKVLRIIGRKLRGLISVIEELSFSTIRGRLIALLVGLAREGRQTPQGLVVTLSSNNQEIAAQIGTVRELVSRNFSRLQEEDLIRIEGRNVVLLNLKALQEELERRD
jgi:CRP-like cAMP-binding protein